MPFCDESDNMNGKSYVFSTYFTIFAQKFKSQIHDKIK